MEPRQNHEQPNTSKPSPASLRSRAKMDGDAAPFPGMADAFEAHTGQSWTDPDWRRDAAMWAAAWKAALRQAHVTG